MLSNNNLHIYVNIYTFLNGLVRILKSCITTNYFIVAFQDNVKHYFCVNLVFNYEQVFKLLI